MQNKRAALEAATEAHYTAAQLAGLPGMPTLYGDVTRRMKRHGIPGRAKQGQGGGREWPLSALPQETRTALAAKSLSTLSTQLPPAGVSSASLSLADTRTTSFSSAARDGQLAGQKLTLQKTIGDRAALNRQLAGLKSSINAPVSGQERIDAKLAILSALDRFHQTSGLAIRVARPDFARRYNAGEIAVEPWVRERVDSVSDASLWRWQKDIREGGIARLAGGYGNRRGQSIIEQQPELHQFVVGMLVRSPHCTSKAVGHGIRARFRDASLELPSPRSLQRWIAVWRSENKAALLAIANPDEWKNRYLTALGSQSEDVARLNQRWEMDSTPGDLMLTDGRHTAIGTIDVFSRRFRILVTKTSRATGIATLLRHAMLAWGVPDQVRTDGGADYVSNHVVRVLRGLVIEHQICNPFSPWEKPHIERAFHTFSHGLVELLSGFIGHNVAERKELEARASFADRLMKRGETLEVTLSSAEFQRFCDDWCENLYMHEAHDGLGGKTPFEVLSANRDAVKEITDARALDVLLAEAPGNNGKRTVRKKGIELDGAWFIAPEVGRHVGEDVYVKLDPVDLGVIYVFGADEGYLFTAECPERTGVDRREVAIKARSMQVAQVKEQRAALKATAKRARTDDIVNEILTERAENAGKLARLPGPRTAHTSAGLSAAAQAAHRKHAAETRLSDEDMSDLERKVAEPRASRKVVQIDPMEANYRRWLAVEARISAGAVVSDEERGWFEGYRGEPEWVAARRFFARFPELLNENAGAA